MRKRYLFALLAVAIFLTGCLGGPVIPGRISGEVYDKETNAPIRGARVSVGGTPYRTDFQGKFDISVRPGNYELEVSVDGYISEYRRLSLSSEQHINLSGQESIFLRSGYHSSEVGDIKGYVYVAQDSMNMLSSTEADIIISPQKLNSNYEPLVGAKVTIANARPINTDRDGYFQFLKLPPYTYIIRVKHPALRAPIERIVRVHPGQETWFDDYEHPALYGGVGYYLAVGIDNYQYLEDGQELKAPVKDARKAFNALYIQNKLAGLGIILENEKATKNAIRNAIFEAAAQASENDYFVFYFSGISGEDYISPYDSKADYKYRTEITDYELARWLAEFPGQVTVIIDGSESTTMADGEDLNPSTMALKGRKYTVITSAGEGEIVFYEPKFESSVFTHFLAEGLTSPYPADHNKDGNITSQELYNYIDKQMSKFFSGWNDPDFKTHSPDIHIGTEYGNTIIFKYYPY